MLTRTSEEPLTYAVVVYLPGSDRAEFALSWDEGSHPTMQPEPEDSWVREETLKLARVLRRTPKPHLSRWRG